MGNPSSPPESVSGAHSEFADTVASAPPLPDSGVPEFASSGPGDEAPDTQNEPTLSHIGRYALKRPLGIGGLGTVYEAWDPMLSRTVAVKTLQFELDTPERVSLDGLFLNEARAVAGLNHPHIVTVHDAGLSAHGVYIAMERLRGRDLRQALAHGWHPSPMAAAQLARRVADALAYAHARGVIHCDIKPANIFLSAKGKPTVLDFGIARVAHGASVPALEGLVAGSPHYLAPEQLLGTAFDERADVYSLGVVLYEMLAGRKAFDGSSLDQITNAVLYGHPASADAVQPAVPADLAAIASRAMAREPGDRYATAHDLSAALRRWIDAQKGRDAERATQTQRRVWQVAGAAVAVLAVLVVTATWLREKTPATPAVAAGIPAGQQSSDASAAAMTPAAITLPADASASHATSGADLALASPVPARARPPRPERSAKPAPTAAKPVAPVADGVVQLAVTPWGQIEVNGQAAGLTPPLSRLTLRAGTHQITVRNGDNPPFVTTVEVNADKPVTVRHRFGS